MDKEDELEVLLANPSKYTLESGEAVEVYKCKVRQLPQISKLIGILVKELGVESISSSEVTLNLDDPSVYFTLFDKCEEAVLEVISSLCSLDKDQIEELDLAEAIELILCIVKLNRDFFLNRALPLIKRLMPPPQ